MGFGQILLLELYRHLSERRGVARYNLFYTLMMNSDFLQITIQASVFMTKQAVFSN